MTDPIRILTTYRLSEGTPGLDITPDIARQIVQMGVQVLHASNPLAECYCPVCRPMPVAKTSAPVAADKPLPVSEAALLMDAMEDAWTVIANASGGDWRKESPEWQAAATRWRDMQWNPALKRNGYARFMDARLLPPVAAGKPACYGRYETAWAEARTCHLCCHQIGCKSTDQPADKPADFSEQWKDQPADKPATRTFSSCVFDGPAPGGKGWLDVLSAQGMCGLYIRAATAAELASLVPAADKPTADKPAPIMTATLLSQADIDALGTYDHSLPTGTRIGKRWKKSDGKGGWKMGEYVENPDPKKVGIRWTTIRVKNQTADPPAGDDAAYSGLLAVIESPEYRGQFVTATDNRQKAACLLTAIRRGEVPGFVSASSYVLAEQEADDLRAKLALREEQNRASGAALTEANARVAELERGYDTRGETIDILERKADKALADLAAADERATELGKREIERESKLAAMTERAGNLSAELIKLKGESNA